MSHNNNLLFYKHNFYSDISSVKTIEVEYNKLYYNSIKDIYKINQKPLTISDQKYIQYPLDISNDFLKSLFFSKTLLFDNNDNRYQTHDDSYLTASYKMEKILEIDKKFDQINHFRQKYNIENNEFYKFFNEINNPNTKNIRTISKNPTQKTELADDTVIINNSEINIINVIEQKALEYLSDAKDSEARANARMSVRKADAAVQRARVVRAAEEAARAEAAKK